MITMGSRTLSERKRIEETLVLEGMFSLSHLMFLTKSLSVGCHKFKPSVSSFITMKPVLAAAVITT